MTQVGGQKFLHLQSETNKNLSSLFLGKMVETEGHIFEGDGSELGKDLVSTRNYDRT